MGNLQSDGKKKQKKSRENAATRASTSTVDAIEDTVEDQKKPDQIHKITDEQDESHESAKISFEKIQTPGHSKRQAPQPPRPAPQLPPKVCDVPSSDFHSNNSKNDIQDSP